MSLFGFGPSASIVVKFNAPTGPPPGPDGAKADASAEAGAGAGAGGAGAGSDAVATTTPRPTRRVETMDGTSTEDLVIFAGGENVTGYVDVVVPQGKKLEHIGIKLELLGNIELYYDRGNHHEFAQQTVLVATPGVIQGTKRFEFDFDAQKPYETYNGVNVRCRYFVRATVSRSYSSNIVKEQDFWVENLQKQPEINTTIKMEVGIEDCLHIEFEYNQAKYHLKDVVTGKIYFLLVRIKIKHMELAIIRRESAGTASNVYNESDTLTKFEVMDGAPVRGESIPIRLYLNGFDLTPTYRNIAQKYSVRYYLNLVLVDEEERRYFKQQEITLYRQELG